MSRPEEAGDGAADPAARSESLPICKLRMVPPAVRRRLGRFGITRCDRLLEAVREAGGIASLARRLTVAPEVLEDLVAQADMSRIVGIGNGFGRLLEAIGVRTTRELAAMRPRELWQRLERFNRDARMCRRTPNLDELRSWIAQARRLQLAAVPR